AEVVHHAWGVGQQTPYRGEVSLPRIDTRPLDSLSDVARLGTQIRRYPCSRTARDHLYQPAVQIAEPDRPSLRAVPPAVLVHPQGRDPFQLQLGDQRSAELDHRVHHRVPAHSQLPGHLRHCPALLTHLTERPAPGPLGQNRPGADPRMRLSPRPVRTGRFWTAPAAFPPPQPDRPPTDRQIPHLRLPATLRNSPHPTLRTPHHIGGGLHQHPHFPLHLDAGQHPEPPNAEQNRSRFDTVNHDLWPPLSAVSCNHQEKRGHGSHHGISRLTRRPFAPYSSRRASFPCADSLGTPGNHCACRAKHYPDEDKCRKHRECGEESQHIASLCSAGDSDSQSGRGRPVVASVYSPQHLADEPVRWRGHVGWPLGALIGSLVPATSVDGQRNLTSIKPADLESL